MDEQYILDLFNELGGESTFGKFDDFKELITTDPSYQKDVYDTFGKNTLGEFDDFKSLVSVAQKPVAQTTQPVMQLPLKKKEGSTSPSGTGVLERYGFNINRALGQEEEQKPIMMQPVRTETPAEAEVTWRRKPKSAFMPDYTQPIEQEKNLVERPAELGFIGRYTPERDKEKVPQFVEKTLDALTPYTFSSLGTEPSKKALEYYLKDMGFTVEDSDKSSSYTGKYVNVVAPNGNKHLLYLGNEIMRTETYGFAGLPSEDDIEGLKNFIRYASVSDSSIAKKEYLYEKENQRFKTKESIENEVKEISTQAQVFQDNYKKMLTLQKDIEDIQKDLKRWEDFGEQNTPKYIQTQAYLTERQKELEEYKGTLIENESTLKTQSQQLDKAMGKYFEFQSTQGSFGGTLYRSIAESSVNIFSNFIRSATGKTIDSLPMGSLMDENTYRETYTRKAKARGIDVNEPMDAIEFTKIDKEINAEIRDEFKKAAITGKAGGEKLQNVLTIQGVRESLKEFVTSAPIMGTKEYKEKREKEGNFVERGVIGLAGSLPAMVGGKYIRLANMFMMTTDAVLQEMDNDPDFENVSENEKQLIAAPIGVIGAALEEIGLRSLLKGSSVTTSIVKSILGRVPANASASALRKATFDTVKEMGLRGTLAIAGATLAEAETGGAQQINEYFVKDTYNMLKGKKMFDNPEFLSSQYFYDIYDAARTEAVGGFVMGVPNSIAAAFKKDGFRGLDDETFKIFEQLAKDNDSRKFFVTDLKNKINSGQITGAQGKEIINAYDQAAGMIGTVDDEITDIESRKIAMDLISERKKLEAKRDKMDPGLAKPIQKRIDQINEQLSQITQDAIQKQAASQVSLQPEAGAGQEVEVGGPEAKPKITPEESKRKEDLVAALSQPENDKGTITIDGAIIDRKEAQAELDAIAQKEQAVPAEQGGAEQGVLSPEEEKLRDNRRVDLFPEESEFADVIGGSGRNSSLSNYSEVNGVGVASYTNPDNGLVDVIMSGTSDNDYVGYVRVYENGKPTNRWTSKMSNESGNKDNFKTMISEVQSRLPENHEYTESTNISIDGVRVYSNQLNRGYEVLTDANGNPVTNTVTLNAASVEGLQQAATQEEKQSLYDNMTVTTREQFNALRDKITALMPNARVLWNQANNTVQIQLPVLVQSKKATTVEQTPAQKTFEQRKSEIEKITDPEQRKVAEIEFIMSNLASGVGEASANKIREYADRIISGKETRNQVIQGLPKSFVDGIDQLLAAQQTSTETTPAATEVTPVEQQFTEQDKARKAELEEAMRKADKRRKNITVGETTIPKAEAKAELDALNQKEQATQQPVTPAVEAAPTATAPVETMTAEQEADLLEELMTGKKKETAPVETAPTTPTAEPVVTETATETAPVVEEGVAEEAVGKPKGKKLSDTIRGLEIKGPGGLQSNILGVPIAIWNAGVKTMAAAVKAGAAINEAVQKAIEYIKEKHGKKFNEAAAEKKLLIGHYKGAIEIAREAKVTNEGLKTYFKRQGLTDAQIETLLKVKEKAEKKPISKEKVIGKPKPKKVTVNEMTALKDQLRLEAKAAREAKGDLNTKRKMLTAAIKEMQKKGKITVRQAAILISKVNSVNLDNPVMVERMLDYAEKVFNNAEFVEKMSRARKLLKTAKENIRTKIGVSQGLTTLMDKLFNINPNIIPDAVLESYLELVEMMGKRQAVLTLKEAAELTKDVEKILDAIDNELSALDELIDIFDNYNDKVLDDNGKIDYAATIDKMLEAGVITASDAKLYKKYKDKVLPKEAREKKSEEQLAEEKKDLIDAIGQTQVDENKLGMREERDAVRRLIDAMTPENLAKLTNAELKNLLKVLDNINNGFMPHYAVLMTQKLNAAGRSATLGKAIANAGKLPITKLLANIKSLFPGAKSANMIMVINSPKYAIDQIFGYFKSTPIYDSVFKPIVQAFSSYKTDARKVKEKLDNAFNKVARSYMNNPAKIKMSQFKMMAYALQLEYNSNKDKGEGFYSAADYINETIKHARGDQSTMSKKDVEFLDKILKVYGTRDADGNIDIDIDKLYNSFNNAEKQAIKAIQEVNMSIRDKAMFTAAVVRGDKMKPIDNYIHHNVLPTGVTDTDLRSVTQDMNARMTPSTRAKVLKERTKGAKPLNFNIFNATQKAANEVLMDFHLTEAVRTSRMVLNNTRKELQERGNEKQLNAFNAVAQSFETTLDNTLTNTFNDSSFVDSVVALVTKQAYRTLLAGASRWTAELMSNLSYVTFVNPIAYKNGITKYRKFVMSEKGPAILRNIGSAVQDRIYESSVLSGRMIDGSIMDEAIGLDGTTSNYMVVNAMQTIYNNTLKKGQNFVAATADALISTPDKMALRPFWFGIFAQNFKKETGQDVDYEKLAANDEAYLSKFKNVINKSKDVADSQAMLAGGTKNPFAARQKSMSVKGASALAQMYQSFNNFLNSFIINEYIAARTGVYAMMGNGKINRRQGAAMLAGVTTRTTLYTLLVKELGRGLAWLFLGDDDEEEEEKSITEKAGQAFAGSMTSLILGRDFGNMTRSMINYGVEKVNENYVQDMMDGKYTKEDVIAFNSLIPSSLNGRPQFSDLMINMTGPAQPIVRSLKNLYENSFAAEAKGEDTIKKRENYWKYTLPLEAAGHLGFVPLYKDVRTITNKALQGEVNAIKEVKEEEKVTKAEAYGNYKTLEEFEEKDPIKYDEYSAKGGKLYKYREDERKEDEEKNKDKPFRGLSEEKFKEYYPKEWAKNYGPGSAYFRRQNSPAMLQKKAQEEMRKAQLEQKRKIAAAKREQQEALKKALGK